MDSTEHLRARLEALEHHVKTLEVHARSVERRLSRWRGIAGAMVLLGIMSLPLPSSKAQEIAAWISDGVHRSAPEEFDWAAGSFFADQ
jgi:hypothetical protein